jgi:hypothetical protein
VSSMTPYSVDSVSQTGFPGTLGFHRTPLGVSREIVITLCVAALAVYCRLKYLWLTCMISGWQLLQYTGRVSG